jgi:rod shape-determining protein MreC
MLKNFKNLFKKLDKKVFITLVIIFLVALLNNFEIIRITSATRDVLSPLAKQLNARGSLIGQYISSIKNINQITNQVDYLSENNELKKQIFELNQLREENEQLRRQLGLNDRKKLELRAGEVIGYLPNGIHALLEINLGSRDGVTNGDTVLGNGVLIGYVSQVGAKTAIVTPSTNPKFNALAMVSVKNVPGLVVGDKDGLVMRRIPISQDISKGDIVKTSGLDGQFVPGLIIGEITAVNLSEDSIFKHAQLIPLSRPEHNRFVEVIIR